MSFRRFAPVLARCVLLIATAMRADSQAPSFAASGVVNAATGQAVLAPYSICTIYGTSLSLKEPAMALGGSTIPTNVGGISVSIGILQAGVLYVSENQINFLIPNSLAPGSFSIRVTRDKLQSAQIPIAIQETAPGIFTSADGFAAATHADGRPLTPDSPAVPGEVVVLYATGFGRTVPDPPNLAIAIGAARIVHMPDFQISFDAVPVEFPRIQYVGLAPGNAGLYQVNVQLPEDVGDTPEVRVTVAGVTSPAGVLLAVRRPPS